MKPGDVWVVDIPELGTHEQSGIRPAVIIARVTKTIVTIIPCTSNMLALRFPYTHLLEQSKENGLAAPSVALVFHLRALDVSYLKKKIGRVDKKTLAAIRAQARKLIG
ncbi:MAG: type II toxin-antitoxin system PemK/MazF family toxin [bacterium]|nr:type II toxin-antitoxin system PemK/MazF family toxin [bacterium]